MKLIPQQDYVYCKVIDSDFLKSKIQKLESGIEIITSDIHHIECEVLAVGDECSMISKGDTVCVSPLDINVDITDDTFMIKESRIIYKNIEDGD